MEVKVFEALKWFFDNFEFLEDFQLEQLVEYINCPEDDDCEYDGTCTECKIKWLNSEWK